MSHPSSSIICLSLYPAIVDTSTISMANQAPPRGRQKAELARLVRISAAHGPVGFVAFMRSKCATAVGKSRLLSATSQLSWLNRVLRLKLMPQFAVLRCAITALPLSVFHTDTDTLAGIMNMSMFTPKACAMRLVFFSIRMHVEPHPNSKAAYSARNAAIPCKTVLSLNLFIILVVTVIVVVGNSGYFIVPGYEEHIRFSAKFK